MKWISRLKSIFGIPFLLLITSIYWTQGFRSFAWMAISYQMKDELKLSPAASQFVLSTSFIPWSVKPIYGIFSDCVPIRGARRIPYLIISSILCFIPWLILGLAESSRSSYIQLTVLLTIQNVGSAMADVVVDAMVAESARQERAEFAGDLQSLSWIGMAFGGIIGSLTGGVALEMLKVKGIFLMFSVFPLVQLLTCTMLDEKTLGKVKQPILEIHTKVLDEEVDDDVPEIIDGQQDINPQSPVTKSDGHLKDTNNSLQLPVVTGNSKSEAEKLDEWVEVETAVGKGRVMKEDDVEGTRVGNEGLVQRRKAQLNTVDHPVPADEEKSGDKRTITAAIKAACVSLYYAVKQPPILRPMVWFLISQSIVPNLSTIMFYYQTNILKLDASFLGSSRVVGWSGLMLGTFLYNHYFKRVSLRTIFRWVHIGLGVLTLVDLVLVFRLNSYIGIPDKVFVLGASALGDAVSQFKFMPFLVFSGQLCPPGIEGTLFALFMSVNNLGGTLSSFSGAALAWILGISSDEFDKLALGIGIQAACTVLPVFLLFLIPQDATGTVASSP